MSRNPDEAHGSAAPTSDGYWYTTSDSRPPGVNWRKGPVPADAEPESSGVIWENGSWAKYSVDLMGNHWAYGRKYEAGTLGEAYAPMQPPEDE